MRRSFGFMQPSETNEKCDCGILETVFALDDHLSEDI